MNKVDPSTKDSRKGKVKQREAMTSYLGIDVSKDWLDVVLLREALPTEKGQFDNTHQGFRQLQHFLKKRKVKALHACLEATGYYGAEVAFVSAPDGLCRQCGQSSSDQSVCGEPVEPHQDGRR